MDKSAALQTFIDCVDIPAVRAAFPDLDYAVTELEDGQQEIVVRLQGIDPGFHPSADIATIEAKTVDQVTDFTIKSPTTLRKQIRKDKLARFGEHNVAIAKRVKALLLAAGLTCEEGCECLRAVLLSGGNA